MENKLERLFVEGENVNGMNGKPVKAIPLHVDMITWDGKGELEEVARKLAPPKANGFACGPCRDINREGKSCYGVIYFKVVPQE